MIVKFQSKQSGFSMLEVLVALVVVSVGLLGIAGIIATGLKVNGSSYARSQVSWQANDIIDSMRANITAAQANPSPYNLAIGTAAPTTTDVASTDLARWRTALSTTLPAGTGSVTLDPATQKVTVVVQWNDSRATGGAAAQQFITETRL
jgi:type IV pilus assembly protein PilV